jgi:hypothetical protein
MVGKFVVGKRKSQVVRKWIWCSCSVHIQQRGSLVVFPVSFSGVRSNSTVPKSLAAGKKESSKSSQDSRPLLGGS